MDRTDGTVALVERHHADLVPFSRKPSPIGDTNVIETAVKEAPPRSSCASTTLPGHRTRRKAFLQRLAGFWTVRVPVGSSSSRHPDGFHNVVGLASSWSV